MTTPSQHLRAALDEAVGDRIDLSKIDINVPYVSRRQRELNAQKDKRERDSGRYKHTTFEKICVCGHPLGEHSAEAVAGKRPCFHGDFAEDEFCDCEKFKTAPKSKQPKQPR